MLLQLLSRALHSGNQGYYSSSSEVSQDHQKLNSFTSFLLFPKPNPPCTPSNPSFFSPTCPLKSAPMKHFSLRIAGLTRSSYCSKNSSLSNVWQPCCGAYAETMFTTSVSTMIFAIINRSDTPWKFITCFFSSSSKTMPTPFLFSLPVQNSLNRSPISLVLYPFHLISCTHIISTLLLLMTSATSLPLPAIHDMFQLAILKLFDVSSCMLRVAYGIRPNTLLLSHKPHIPC